MCWHPIPSAFAQMLPPPNKCLPPRTLPLLCLSIHLDPSSSIPPDLADVSPPSRTMSQGTPKGLPHLKWQEVAPLHKALTRSHQEAFSWDSHLVRKTREEYFQSHCPNFNNENSHDLTDIFRCMIETTGLLGSAIHKIKEAWTVQDELWQANYMLRTLPKGLKFFRVVSPSESPKVMGLTGIHNPNALCNFNGLYKMSNRDTELYKLKVKS